MLKEGWVLDAGRGVKLVLAAAYPTAFYFAANKRAGCRTQDCASGTFPAGIDSATDQGSAGGTDD